MFAGLGYDLNRVPLMYAAACRTFHCAVWPALRVLVFKPAQRAASCRAHANPGLLHRAACKPCPMPPAVQSMTGGCAAEVFTWGRGEYGRLGLNDRQGGSKLRAQAVPGLGGPQHCVVQASCGGTHTLVLTAQVRCWVPRVQVLLARQVGAECCDTQNLDASPIQHKAANRSGWSTTAWPGSGGGGCGRPAAQLSGTLHTRQAGRCAVEPALWDGVGLQRPEIDDGLLHVLMCQHTLPGLSCGMKCVGCLASTVYLCSGQSMQIPWPHCWCGRGACSPGAGPALGGWG